MKAYSGEMEYCVLSDILDGIETFKSFAERLQVTNELNKLIIDTVSPCALKIGWDAAERNLDITNFYNKYYCKNYNSILHFKKSEKK